jgi:uncharacterized protein (TIGR00251 family)
MTDPTPATWWSASADAVLVRVRAVPGARITAVAGPYGDGRELRVRVAAPAADGAANEELRRFLASAFRTHRSAVRITHGRRSRRKVVQVVGARQPPASLVRSAGGAP